MKIAYIVLAHNNPKHLQRLVNRLSFDNSFFFIHIDKKKDLNSFSLILEESKNVAFIKKREDGQWGDIGIVKATINALCEINDHVINFDRIVLLSGQDYPIKSNQEIVEFFSKNKEINFIEHTPFPVEKLTFGGLHRINHNSYNLLGKRHTFVPFKHNKGLNLKGVALNTLLLFGHIFSKRRKVPYHLSPQYGSQWWSITGEVNKAILKFINDKPEYLSYHEKSLLPDEMFFQTIILSIVKKENIMNNNVHLIIWEGESSHPKVFKTEDLDTIKESKDLFARKFKENSLILDQIDNLIK